MKDEPRTAVLKTARTIRAITRDTPTRFILNDDLAVAIESDADGLHLGQGDPSLPEARTEWNFPGKLFGLSTHGAEQAHNALGCSPDYIGIGPVCPTPPKPRLPLRSAPKNSDESCKTRRSPAWPSAESIPIIY